MVWQYILPSQQIRQTSKCDLGASAPVIQDSQLNGFEVRWEGRGDLGSIYRRVIVHECRYLLIYILCSVPPHFRLAPREDHAGELVDLVKEPGGEQEAAAEWTRRVSLHAGFVA